MCILRMELLHDSLGYHVIGILPEVTYKLTAFIEAWLIVNC